MYDLEILVPAETTVEAIKIRFSDFKKWGLLNIKERKIKLILACSPNNDLNFLKSDWPENVDVEVLETPYGHVAQRIYFYYSDYIKPNTAKWYVRLDEDSITDVDELMNNLEREFDHEREYHLAGELNYDVHDVERAILTQLGYSHWYWEESPAHEHEISVTSNAAMANILSNPSAKTYFMTRKEFAEGFGDHGLCFCARIAKIHPTRVPFLTRETELCRLSIYGGKLNHIHWTGRDKHPQVYDWVELTYLNTRDDFFVDKKFLLLKPGLSFFATFGSRGAIHSNLDNKLIGIWGTTKDNKLTVYFRDMKQNAPLVVFDKDGTNNYICRDFKLSII